MRHARMFRERPTGAGQLARYSLFGCGPAALGRKLASFRDLFAECFGRRDARELSRVYVKEQLSDLKRKKPSEAIVLKFRAEMVPLHFPLGGVQFW
jgi:hypothetical protein